MDLLADWWDLGDFDSNNMEMTEDGQVDETEDQGASDVTERASSFDSVLRERAMQVEVRY